MRISLKVLLAVLFMSLLLACMNTNANVISGDPDAASIEVVYFEQEFKTFLVYKVELEAPQGTVLEVEGEGKFEMKDDEYNFTLAHEITDRAPAASSGIITNYFSDRSASESRFIPVPSAGFVDYETVNIQSLGDFPQPGTYSLREGETFSLAKIENNSYSVTLVELP